MNNIKTHASVTLSVTINAPYDTAFDYIADPYHLAEWSVNFIKQVKNVNGQAVAATPFGEAPVSIRSDRDTGVLDIILGDAFLTRLVRNHEGCDYMFTLQQPPNMPDDVWQNEGVPGLREELETLKRMLETRR